MNGTVTLPDGRTVELVEVEVCTYHSGYYNTDVRIEPVTWQNDMENDFDPNNVTLWMEKK
jgi:hypothetical protein